MSTNYCSKKEICLQFKTNKRGRAYIYEEAGGNKEIKSNPNQLFVFFQIEDIRIGIKKLQRKNKQTHTQDPLLHNDVTYILYYNINNSILINYNSNKERF